MVTASIVSMPFAQENELHLLRLSTIQYRRHCSNEAEQEFFSVIVNKLAIW